MLINKEKGPTSAEVLRRISRLIGKKHKIGHAGTLDPDGEGLLVVLIDDATKLSETVMDLPKVYEAVIEFGVTTDTYDAAGEVEERKDISGVSEAAIRELLPRFTGQIQQIPPPYSAVKVKGKRSYELARKGIKPDLKAREAWVYDLELKSWDPPEAEISVTCGKGMYLRSLAHDMGRELGCGGHVKSLRRTSVGPLVPRTTLEDIDEENWREHIVDGANVFEGADVFVLNERGALALRRGMPVRASDFNERPREPVGKRTGVLDEKGRLIAIAKIGHGGTLLERRIILPL